MTDQDNLRDRIADVVESAGLQWDTDFNAWMLGRPNSADPGPQSPRIAQAIIDEFGLNVVYSSRQHANGSALEFGETPEEYAERVRMKTIHKIEGRFSE